MSESLPAGWARVVSWNIGAAGLLLVAGWEILVYPVVWWVYVGLACFLTLGALQFKALRTQRARCLALGAALTILITAYAFPWTSRKPFLRELNRVQLGMTESQVRDIMNGYMEGTGWPAGPPTTGSSLLTVGSGVRYEASASPDGELEIRNALVFRHSNEGRFNSDWGIVSFEDGKVISVEFSPD